jgi:hypothetical protein
MMRAPERTAGARDGLACTLRLRRLVQPDLLFGGSDRLARFQDLRLDLGDRAFELSAAFDQRLDEHGIGRAGLSQQAPGPGFLLDFPVQSLRIAAQPLHQRFQLGEKTAPFV